MLTAEPSRSGLLAKSSLLRSQPGRGKILTSAQQQWLGQINVQLMQPQCFTFPRGQKRLRIPTAQQQAIAKILDQDQQDWAQLRRSPASHPVENIQEKLQARRRQTEHAVLQVLTELPRQGWQEGDRWAFFFTQTSTTPSAPAEGRPRWASH